MQAFRATVVVIPDILHLMQETCMNLKKVRIKVYGKSKKAVNHAINSLFLILNLVIPLGFEPCSNISV